MTDTTFISVVLLVALSTAIAYLVASLLMRRPAFQTGRVLLCGALASVLTHVYLLGPGGGLDQFVLVSLAVTFAWGCGGAALLEWLRKAALKR